ncbi:carbohydrate binding domain-containing protein [Metabacillus litoralis]|uniref:carbohydrate binding domain-containing protein n=1 Tax=Metabacillus litoralis TaxID=152268 RepID=UPI001E31A779|nr:carbohydrate binding domain-containing protein [Metabacillus litoralis]UHA60211.1 carbohydrate binding domain-containing protein [Metabacillus litoralis]
MQNRSISLALIIILLITFISPNGSFWGYKVDIANAEENNLITNGGFETGDLSGWNTSESPKFKVTLDEFNKGDHSLEVSGPQDWNGIKHTVEVKPNTDYVLSFYGKGGGGAAYKVLAADESTITENYTVAQDEWLEYEVSFNSGENNSVIVYISDSGQKAYYDDFTLAEELENLVSNGDFETGDFSGWDTGDNPKFSISSEEKNSGEHSLEVSGPQDWNGIKHTVEVKPNTDYVLSFYGKGGGGAAYKVLAADESTITENYTVAQEEWFEYEVSFNSGDNDKVIIYVSDASEKAYYDDFYIGDPVRGEPLPSAPIVSNVIITGEAKVTKKIVGNYEYTHEAGISEGYSIYRWLQSDGLDGEYTKIQKANGKEYVPTNELIDKYIKLEVTPVDTAGIAGEPVLSDAIGPIQSSSLLDDLKYKIENAEIIISEAKIGSKYGEYSEDSYNEFNQTILNAKDISADPESTEDIIKNEIAKIEDALIEFEKARNKMESPFDHFISTKGDKLFDGEKEFRFISYNYPGALYNEDEAGGIMPTAFEQEDAIRTIEQVGGKVFRTYSLTVKDKNDSENAIRHITGPGQINEEAFKSMDKLLQLANEYEIRVIIPFIDNWDWPPGGITDFAHFRGKERLDFYSDPQLIEDFKLVMEKVLNRVNSYTGVKYKDDPAILAWETGNELMAAPEWMNEIAAHYKSINTNQLLISGNQMELPHNYKNITDAALQDPNIDIVKSHYYSGNYANKVIEDKAKASQNEKPFIVGEFGFKPTSEIEAMLDEVIKTGTSGAMLWSLRPHSFNGGFIQHDEMVVDGILYRPYHWPGMPSGDYYDASNVMKLLREKAYEIQGEDTPKLPIPEQPPVMFESDSISNLRWRGSTGASSYTVERSANPIEGWEVVGDGILDDVAPGEDMYADLTAVSGKEYYYRVKGVNDSGESPYSNVIGPIVAKYILKDSLDDQSKQYYSDDKSITYRTPSSILSFTVDATANGDLTLNSIYQVMELSLQKLLLKN